MLNSFLDWKARSLVEDGIHARGALLDVARAQYL